MHGLPVISAFVFFIVLGFYHSKLESAQVFSQGVKSPVSQVIIHVTQDK